MTADSSESAALTLAADSPAQRASTHPEGQDAGDFAALGYTALGPFGSDRALRDGALVLSAMSIPHGVARGSGGGYLLVRDHDYGRARGQLDRYEEENRDFPPQRRRERPRYSGLPFVALAFALLVAFAWVTGPVAKPQGAWFQQGSSVSQLVLSSEPYRAVTALTLHADAAHVLSNLVSGAIFGRALEKRLGPGAAGLAIVGAGAVGNVANAMFYASLGEPHRSIGASTAVFAAVGLLATSQLFLGTKQTRTPQLGQHHVTEYIAPLIGGLALLGALGSSPNTDIGAHAFGLLAGFVIGVPFAWLARRSRSTSPALQAALGVLALGVVGGSWALALA